ncbi:Hypothetical_protein [Hexamita inflata]|uniref:Hypothetical_protein n=1 Tax=Hexamita inflata TaxID=28002 RepID=A0AA86PSL4_9EUKA|nr:Hypothetical protein HINF_LOCUS33049 [Hexamita inflata]
MIPKDIKKWRKSFVIYKAFRAFWNGPYEKSYYKLNNSPYQQYQSTQFNCTNHDNPHVPKNHTITQKYTLKLQNSDLIFSTCYYNQVKRFDTHYVVIHCLQTYVKQSNFSLSTLMKRGLIKQSSKQIEVKSTFMCLTQNEIFEQISDEQKQEYDVQDLDCSLKKYL